jgi:anti-anti-sigma factor
VHRGERWTLVALQGELDLHNAHIVRAALEAECAHNPPRLVIDLAKVTFLDSTVIHVLVDARKLLGNGKGRGLLLVGPTPPIARTLATCGVHRVLAVHGTPPDVTAP